ncbi:autotransporter-associated beta strand repeat-containing protein [Candidatus Paracaedibacter symbiosus]|uniref:autotransporter-associated beta strand repeat-containing protein n=1 Tax=Candidatus Paracaedibacter symbiosus TaxID=244582 RepID=UPI00068D95AA|nr:autotransporter-associated beta strand repeat-containing protein [Candidatus Paracaedibacter symbiosus]
MATTQPSLAIADGGTSGTLNKAGLGTLTLTGANTYTGGTNIHAGTLALSGLGALDGTSTVTVDNLATFDISAGLATTMVGALVGSGSVHLGLNTLQFGNTDPTPQTFSGVIGWRRWYHYEWNRRCHLRW